MSTSSASSATLATTAASATPTTAAASVDYALVERALGFHGVPMQKVWEGEHGDQDLARAAVAPDFGVYQARQKGFAFSDRTKRLHLHQFFARKADVLYGHQHRQHLQRSQLQQQLKQRTAAAVAAAGGQTNGGGGVGVSDGVASSLMPYNSYFSEKLDKSALLQHIYTVSKWPHERRTAA